MSFYSESYSDCEVCNTSMLLTATEFRRIEEKCTEVLGADNTDLKKAAEKAAKIEDGEAKDRDVYCPICCPDCN